MTLNRIMRYMVKKKITTMAQRMLPNEISASTTSLLLGCAAGYAAGGSTEPPRNPIPDGGSAATLRRPH